jgi:hypothetical protein
VVRLEGAGRKEKVAAKASKGKHEDLYNEAKLMLQVCRMRRDEGRGGGDESERGRGREGREGREG